jgi:FlaA1/EpsC-like NDP-sugar epimerase
VIATRTIDPRPGEKPYEELMTEDESSRAADVGDMYAVLPSIEVPAEVAEGYRAADRAPVGAYRSDGVAALEYDEVVRLVRETYGRDEAELAEAARG